MGRVSATLRASVRLTALSPDHNRRRVRHIDRFSLNARIQNSHVCRIAARKSRQEAGFRAIARGCGFLPRGVFSVH
jgi:hypothetical protein